MRERYGLLETKYKKHIANEMSQSGINTEPTEFDMAIEDIINQFENQEETALRATEAEEAECLKNKTEAEEIRQMAMETFCETRKRSLSSEENQMKKNPVRRHLRTSFK